MDIFEDNSDGLFSDDDLIIEEKKDVAMEEFERLLQIDYYNSMLATYNILVETAVSMTNNNEKLERFNCILPTPGFGVVKKTTGLYTRYHISARKSGSFGSAQAKSIKFIGHRLALAIKMKVPYNKMTGDASHLCHSKLGCIREDHLNLESHIINMQRNSCAGFHYYRDSDTLVCFCEHEPRCEFVRTFESANGYPF